MMAEKNNATCAICGKGYHMCLSCKDIMNASPWKKHTDTSEHYKVYQVIHGYSTGIYTKEEAKDKLQNIDLSDLKDFRNNIKTIINDIMKEDKKVVVEEVFKKDEVAVEECAVDTSDVLTDVEIANDYASSKINMTRKRKYSK